MAERDAVLERVRKLCLSLPDVFETQSWGHPNWKAGKRIFAAFNHYRGHDCIAFLAEVGFRDVLVRDERFFDGGYGRGDKTWVCLKTDVGRLNWKEVEQLLTQSHRLAWSPPKAPRKAAAAKKPATRPRRTRTPK
ncbi:MmcQ/YjbR family DNA-binding protein [Hyalangium rubrum]|uniref:MmcQ/YjbR family DNA-binding protein n=1 Tax=Hyalangium rubrum TaxID=3103134 RepID=A0ABU5HAP0_9BACT|nr:MmcQ/YjbR family DNA-binding protein [Hyalangium sp. s54d21]MDY7230154.1 MmcQ/YjbR family DNA-binding protein [Hyalangium sp. s54d21]